MNHGASFDNLTLVTIQRMARREGVELGPRHWQILAFAYEYHREHRVGPLYYTLKKILGVERAEIARLFPHGLSSVYIWLSIPIHTLEAGCKPLARVDVRDYREVYLDHNGTTYLRPEIQELLCEYYSGKLGFGNPSASTSQGQEAFDRLRKARRAIASVLDVSHEEIVFTGGGSEANNTVIKGIAENHRSAGGHIVTSPFEHSSVRKTLEWLEGRGFSVTRVGVDSSGVVDPAAVRKAVRNDTILVCLMAVNNEIGTIQPLEAVGELCRARRIAFFVDAVQGFGRLDIRPKESGITALSLSAHKFYGPKGVGAFFLDAGLDIPPLLHGGGQEGGLRSGTENVGHIIALGEAARLAARERVRENSRLFELRDYFLDRLFALEPRSIIYGDLKRRVPQNLSVGFPDIDTRAMILSLNAVGVFASAGSACSSGRIGTSPVLEAIGADTERYGAIRFSFGLKTTRDDLDYLFTYLPAILKQIRSGEG